MGLYNKEDEGEELIARRKHEGRQAPFALPLVHQVSRGQSLTNTKTFFRTREVELIHTGGTCERRCKAGQTLLLSHRSCSTLSSVSVDDIYWKISINILITFPNAGKSHKHHLKRKQSCWSCIFQVLQRFF